MGGYGADLDTAEVVARFVVVTRGSAQVFCPIIGIYFGILIF